MMGSKHPDDAHHTIGLNRGGHIMDSPDHGDGDSDGAQELPSSEVSCSICLELVSYNGFRSRAKLQCGHEFHLDCIGSAFNMKGAMQCPNCRKVEKGQWLYANGTARSLPDLSMEDWLPDGELYSLSYPEMPFGVWCPFGDFAQVGSSYEELEYPSSTYHDIRAHHAIFAEHTVGPSMAHSYLAYVGPVQAPPLATGDAIEDSSLSHQWDGIAGHGEAFNLHASSAHNNIQYHGWGRHSTPFAVATSHGAEPIPVAAASRRSHAETDAITRRRSYPYPFLFGYRSNPRTGSSGFPRRSGSGVQMHERLPHHHHTFHHQASTTPIAPSHVIRRVVPVPPPPAPLPDQLGSFYVLPPNSSSQNVREREPDHFQSWEREWLSPFPVAPREPGWGIHPHATTSSSELPNRSTTRYWQRHLSYYSS